MFDKFFESRGFDKTFSFFIGLGLTILVIILSFIWFTFGYWLISLILPMFFDVSMPFSLTYSLGGWLIAIIVGSVFAPFLRVNLNHKE